MNITSDDVFLKHAHLQSLADLDVDVFELEYCSIRRTWFYDERALYLNAGSEGLVIRRNDEDLDLFVLLNFEEGEIMISSRRRKSTLMVDKIMTKTKFGKSEFLSMTVSKNSVLLPYFLVEKKENGK